MGEDVELGCRCGQIHGWARDVAPKGVNRVVCYCDDCQAFMHFLARAELLDEHGGTDVVQLPPCTISYDRGVEQIVAMRLSEKGMYRWYANCCRTPLGNTADPSVPFVGMPIEVFRGASDLRRADELFGKPRSYVMGRFAVGSVPHASPGLPVRVMAKAVVKVLGWKIRGKSWPHPYFEKDTGKPKYPVAVLTPAQREALRARCGPNPERGTL